MQIDIDPCHIIEFTVLWLCCKLNLSVSILCHVFLWYKIIITHIHTHTHLQPFYSPLFGTTRLSQYQKRHSPTHAWNMLCHHSEFYEAWGRLLIEASAPTIWLDATPSRPSMPPPPSFPQFDAKCLSCRNPPNLSWLGTGTKYAGLHTWRHKNNCNDEMVYVVLCIINLVTIADDFQAKHCVRNI